MSGAGPRNGRWGRKKGGTNRPEKRGAERDFVFKQRRPLGPEIVRAGEEREAEIALHAVRRPSKRISPPPSERRPVPDTPTMKPTISSILQKKSDVLDEFNKWQCETVRRESAEVKQCYTTQAHQTLMLSALILGAGVKFLADANENPFILMATMVAIVLLCLATLHMGCHKYNTSNRALGYEIHLARVIEYRERNDESEKLTLELRRIDWEQAMFAWRIVQPVIFDFFLFEDKRRGILKERFPDPELLKKEKRVADPRLLQKEKAFIVDRIAGQKKQELKRELTDDEKAGVEAEAEKELDSVKQRITDYPWYDSRALLTKWGMSSFLEKSGQPTESARFAQFYPGSYLRKSMGLLKFVVILCMVVFAGALGNTWYDPIMADVPLYSYPYVIPYLTTCGACLAAWSAKRHLDHFQRRGAILESGLLSIQTSAFVWRIVCLAHLRALVKAGEENKTSHQLYNKYTRHLGAIACELRSHLHDVQTWLEKTESFLNEKLPPIPTAEPAPPEQSA